MGCAINVKINQERENNTLLSEGIRGHNRLGEIPNSEIQYNTFMVSSIIRVNLTRYIVVQIFKESSFCNGFYVNLC
ncbi:MAG: hypothetical protein P8Y23_07530 [Candidatus Lokiarchaeota archaeon]|jgi:hypothetical protein